ncbi:hypothetical protein GQX74_005883 [Glossina fuscipes]|nr:hypothetical protein GQX74_005883 [Glossina fuscipes]
MDVKHQKKSLGRIVFGLFGKNSPKTVTNFRHICLRGINGSTYVGSNFHRVINRFLIQGGDIINGDGTGSTSIYGDYFEDEDIEIEHNRPAYHSNQFPMFVETQISLCFLCIKSYFEIVVHKIREANYRYIF